MEQGRVTREWLRRGRPARQPDSSTQGEHEPSSGVTALECLHDGFEKEDSRKARTRVRATRGPSPASG
jgi:hypothetical protein